MKLDSTVQQSLLGRNNLVSSHTYISDISGVNSARLTASDGDLLKPMDFDLFTGWLVKYMV